MAPTGLLRGYQMLSPRTVKSATVQLKKHDVTISLDIPDAGLQTSNNKMNEAQDAQKDRSGFASSLLRVHTEFKTALQPDQAQNQSFDQQCRAELNAISLFFPGIRSERVHTCSAAWLAFACAMDDILETLPVDEGEAVLYDCIEIFQGRVTFGEKRTASDTRIQHLSRTLYKHCTRYLAAATCLAFFREVCEVLRAHLNEMWFLGGRIPQDLPTYMKIRSRTIALNPMLEVIKHEYLPPKWRINALWENLQHEVSCVAGLQNDLVGLERDLEDGEQLNAAVVLMRSQGWSKSDVFNRELFTECVGLTVDEHNKSVERVLARVAQVYQVGGTDLPEFVVDVMRHIVLVCETHLKWCTNAKRYKAKFDLE